MPQHHFYLTAEELKILKAARKKKRVTCKEFSWWALVDLMRKGGLNKVLPHDDRSGGWPYFILSPRGRRYLKSLQKEFGQPQP